MVKNGLHIIAAAILFIGTASAATAAPKLSSTVQGTFVSDSYAKRSKGYDWVAVSIKKSSDNTASVSVTSRADIKRRTCEFSGTGTAITPLSLLVSLHDGHKMLVAVSADGKSVKLSPYTKRDSDALRYYCSGGGSLEGVYTRINGQLDRKQMVAKAYFQKKLSLQGIEFTVTASDATGGSALTIVPKGYKNSNEPVKRTIDAVVTGAEVEDLNSDGAPELLVYTRSLKNDYGSVIAYSSNKKLSMSEVYFPGHDENTQLYPMGYYGFDEFSTVETYLGQRFALYVKNAEGLKKTGKMVDITYKMVDGENGRKFIIHQVNQYDVK